MCVYGLTSMNINQLCYDLVLINVGVGRDKAFTN